MDVLIAVGNGCDVNDFAALLFEMEAGVTQFGAIDVVVANAGIECWAPVETVEMDADQPTISDAVSPVQRMIPCDQQMHWMGEREAR